MTGMNSERRSNVADAPHIWQTVLLLLAVTSIAAAGVVDDFASLDRWSAFGGAQMLHDTRESISGNGRSLHIRTANGRGGVERTALLEVEPGNRFSAGITIRTADAAYLEVMGMPGEVAIGRAEARTDFEFDELVVKATVPKGVTALRIRLVVDGAGLKRNFWDRFEFDPAALADAPVATEPEPTGPDPIEVAARWEAYRKAMATAKWNGAREIRVRSAATTDDTLGVVVPVESRKGDSYAVLDATGRPIAAQSDDLDGDGLADEVCFLLPMKVGATPSVHLLSTRSSLPGIPSDLDLETTTTGSWAPVRMQPSHGYGATQHSTYLSPTNAARARELLDRMEKPEVMVRVRYPDFQVLIGRETGQIEGMRPSNVAAEVRGSQLREFVMDAPAPVRMTRQITGPVRCRFEWQDGNAKRRIDVWRNGVIESTWQRAPARLQVIACAYPYRYLQSSRSDVVRYSRMLERGRSLSSSALSFFGRNDASLRVEGGGVTATRHEVWLDSGEIGWEIGMDAHEKRSFEHPISRITRIGADTYVAGGMHVTTWERRDDTAKLTYRIGSFGADALDGGTGLTRATSSLPTSRIPRIAPGVPSPPVALKFETKRLKVNRLHPSDINGWELRPVTLAKRNPQPAYFAASLLNHSTRSSEVSIRLEGADWIHSAKVLSRLEYLEIPRRFGRQRVPVFREEHELVPGGPAARIPARGRKAAPIEIMVRPRPGTLGRQRCRLHWGEGNAADLEVDVTPTILFMPQFAPVNELGSELATVGGPAGSPLSYCVRFWGGYTPELIEWYEAAHQDAERQGMWTNDAIHIRGLATQHGEAVDAGREGVDIDKWIDDVLGVMRDPRFVDYRARLYLHDEIWEVLGRKGHYVVPVEWVRDVDRRIVMNSPTAAWPSFQEPAIDKPFEYHLELPNDIPELFYYCGQDSRLQRYARKVIEPRNRLFDRWRANSNMLARAGTETPRPLASFWVSAQLHVIEYRGVRRQIWWLRHQGFDSFNAWATIGHLAPYAGRIMNWMLITVGPVDPPYRRGYLLTDRSLAWMDMREDMELITLVRLLREQREDPTLERRLDDLAVQALEASQRNEFELARHYYVTALKLLRPDLLHLAPRDHYAAPIRTEPIEDLFAGEGVSAAQIIPKVHVAPITVDGNRPPPTIDGGLDNAYLEQGATMALSNTDQGGKPEAATLAYLARDPSHLYVLFSCREPRMDKLRTERTGRDSGVWADDCVEIFVDRAGDGQKIAHIIVNAAGVRYESFAEQGPSWNPDYEVAALREPESDSWFVELKLPYAMFGGPPTPGETWRMNFCRERKPVNELTAWSVTFGSFLNPSRFGRVGFVQ
ncbi:MAG: hypothetical protein CMJ18_06945 [Phycisphaeraceae bacterium]|nr:hypothetical protein [Phycisphaeraceae bacterium]